MTLNQPIQLEGKTIAYAKVTDQKDKIQLIFETDLSDLPIYNMNLESMLS